MNCKIKKTSDGNNKIKASVIVKKFMWLILSW